MSRTHRSREQWQQLINKFEHSGVSQAEFCKTQQINPKYFSLKRSKFKVSAANPATGFVRVNPSSSIFPQTRIILQVGVVRITLPEQMDPGALVHLVKALA